MIVGKPQQKEHMKKVVALLTSLFVCVGTQAASFINNIGGEPLGQIRLDLKGNQDYGAGLGLTYKFNQFVKGHVRAIGYSENDWRGSVVDEGSALVEATLLKSANGGVTLSAIGGGDYAVMRVDFALSVGGRVKFSLHKNVGLFVEGRYRSWRKEADDIPIVGGLSISF